MVDLIDAVEADAGIVSTDQDLTRSKRSGRIRSPKDWQWREWRKYAPLLLVAFAVAFTAWLLRAELHPALIPNDASTHESFARFAEQRIRAGHSPFDAWYPFLGIGTPLFLQYQTLSHILIGAVSIVTGDSAFRWANYLLMCTWPVSIYIGARLLGLDRWQAGAAALFSPMLVNNTGYGFEWGSFTWVGSGMWSMLWAIWVLPMAMGLAWRAVAKGERYALAAFAVGLTCAFHFITGYFVLLSIGVFVIVRPTEFLKRVGRGVLVGIGALLTFAFVFIPTLSGLDFVNINSFQTNTYWQDSYGAHKVWNWLIHGQVFDSGRHPIVTLFVGLGAVVCLVRSRRDESARVPLGLMILGYLLYSGRTVVGFALDHMPGGPDILLHRMIIAVHFAGLLLAGVGAVWAFRLLLKAAEFVLRVPGRRVVAGAVVGVLALVVIWPVLTERKHYADSDATWIAGQRYADKVTGTGVLELINIAKDRGGGRIYAGQLSNWGSATKINEVALLELPLQQDADSLGFSLRTYSLSQNIESAFNEGDPSSYDLFNVRYLLLAPGRQPLVKATQLAERNGYTLWEVNTSGYLGVFDTTEPILANRRNMLAAVEPYLRSAQAQLHRTPLISFDGRSTPAPSSSVNAGFNGLPGTVDSSSYSLDNGRFEGTVTASRPAWVMLKQSYYPHWRATVDGKPVKTAMLAPSFVGVPVPAGTHQVVFQYHSESSYPAYFALGALTLLGLAFGPKVWRRYRASRASKPAPNDPGVDPDVDPDAEPDVAPEPVNEIGVANGEVA